MDIFGSDEVPDAVEMPDAVLEFVLITAEGNLLSVEFLEYARW